MKLSFDCLGAMDHADITLAPLTIVCGENNTGKTNVTYAIYALFYAWRNLFEWDVPAESLKTLRELGAVEIDLEKVVVSEWHKIRDGAANNWKNYLPNALAAPDTRFAKTVLSFDFEIDSEWYEKEFESSRLSEEGKVVFTAKKAPGSKVVQIASLRDAERDSLPTYVFEDFVRDVILEAVFAGYLPKVFMASAERTGAAVFKDELNLTKNKIVTLLSQMDRDRTQNMSPHKIFDAIYTSRYPLPVNHNVQFVNTLSQFDGRLSPLSKSHPQLLVALKKIVGGDFQTTKEGLTYFVPTGTKEKLNLTEASSAVRSLLILWYWLVGEAAIGDLLMIDEPEMNLHPANQRLLARWIAALVNIGVRVFVTTHSDYIIKEFNSLIMMSKNLESVRAAAKSENYHPSEFLNIKDVNLFICQKGNVTKVGNKRKSKAMTMFEASKSVDLGIEATTFDKTINDMNDLFDKIYYAAMETSISDAGVR